MIFIDKNLLIIILSIFFSNKLKLAIELDGYTHSFEDVFEKDKDKEERLNQLGIYVLRFKDSDIMNNINIVLETIQYYIGEFDMEK